MKHDIHKLADYLVKVTREWLEQERKVAEWKQSQDEKALVSKPKAS